MQLLQQLIVHAQSTECDKLDANCFTRRQVARFKPPRQRRIAAVMSESAVVR
jgi:hypothetical protein